MRLLSEDVPLGKRVETENLKSAVEFLKRATAMDPAYAAATAYAELSIIYSLLSSFSLPVPKEYPSRWTASVTEREGEKFNE